MSHPPADGHLGCFPIFFPPSSYHPSCRNFLVPVDTPGLQCSLRDKHLATESRYDLSKRSACCTMVRVTVIQTAPRSRVFISCKAVLSPLACCFFSSSYSTWQIPAWSSWNGQSVETREANSLPETRSKPNPFAWPGLPPSVIPLYHIPQTPPHSKLDPNSEQPHWLFPLPRMLFQAHLQPCLSGPFLDSSLFFLPGD